MPCAPCPHFLTFLQHIMQVRNPEARLSTLVHELTGMLKGASKPEEGTCAARSWGRGVESSGCLPSAILGQPLPAASPCLTHIPVLPHSLDPLLQACKSCSSRRTTTCFAGWPRWRPTAALPRTQQQVRVPDRSRGSGRACCRLPEPLHRAAVRLLPAHVLLHPNCSPAPPTTPRPLQLARM